MDRRAAILVCATIWGENARRQFWRAEEASNGRFLSTNTPADHRHPFVGAVRRKAPARVGQRTGRGPEGFQGRHQGRSGYPTDASGGAAEYHAASSTPSAVNTGRPQVTAAGPE